MTAISANLAQVQDRIARAAKQAGRSPQDITLVAVTKKQPAAAIQEVLALGVADIGENYVQEAADKKHQFGTGRWHLLGHLQTNKAKAAVELFDLIQSVDSVKLAKAIGAQAASVAKTQAILLQVHLGEEETKFGLLPSAVREAAAEIAGLPGVALEGLMGIAPFGEDARPYFRHLRTLFDTLPDAHRKTLSMGMTGDFETAIEEGATLIRIGTAIFGPRTT